MYVPHGFFHKKYGLFYHDMRGGCGTGRISADRNF
jgi:hypothetical protein